MKGDFTRFTFQPSKQYTSVLMQQGRLQLDADWNEQMSIFSYLNQVQARDMIGVSAGTSQTLDGFAINPTSDNSDLIITPGRFYLNGLLCELVAGSEVNVQMLDEINLSLIRVDNWLIDGQKFAPGQWVKVFQKDETNNPIEKMRCQIKSIDDNLQTLQLKTNASEVSSWQNRDLSKLSLRRITTYKTQLDYPNPTDDLGSLVEQNNADSIAVLLPVDSTVQPTASTSQTPSENKIYLVYLDAWQRHVTTIEDSSIREVALQAPDTATRTKTVWQVKLQLLKPVDLSATGNEQKDIIKLIKDAGNRQKDIIELIEKRPEWQKITDGNTNRNSLISGRKVSLIASTDQADGQPGSYHGNDNRLYRVEVHSPGKIDQATFKWSRENGSIVSAIDSIENNIINLISPIKEVHKLFENESGKPLPWLEIIDEEQELKNMPGTLVQLVKAKNNQLEFNLSKVRGTLPTATKSDARTKKIKVRRWHDNASGEILITKDFISIEDGISVKFETEFQPVPTESQPVPQEFRTGDFWLIPARESTQSIEWSRDDLQRFQPQPPQGIYHQYTPIALVKIGGSDGQVLEIEDVRTKFPTLVNCFDKTGDSIQGSLGIGVRDVLATLHVKGTTKKQPDGSIIDLPIAKFDSKDGETQLLIDPKGKVVIGTEAFSPDRLNIKGNTKVHGTVNVIGQANFGNSIQLTSPTSSTGFTIQSDKDLSLIATENLILRGKKINVIGTLQFDQTRFNKIGVNIDPSDNARLQVNGDVIIGESTNTVTIAAPTINAPVKFTTANQQGYQFDKDVQILSGNISFGSDVPVKESISISNSNLIFKTEDINRFTILKGGNIGIGVVNPLTKLDVNGSARFINTNGFFKIEPPKTINGGVEFTTDGESYQFDKKIELTGNTDILKKIIGNNNLTIVSEDQIELSSKKVFILNKLFIGDNTGGTYANDVRFYVAGKAEVGAMIAHEVTAEGLKVNQLNVFSSRTFKDNIVGFSGNEAREVLNGLNPIKFTYKADQDHTLQLGFVAEDIPDVIASSDRQTVNPMNIIATLTRISKDHQDMLIFLNKVIKEQKVEIDALKTKVQSLENR
jgi:Family of unknown function (DUF6519)